MRKQQSAPRVLLDATQPDEFHDDVVCMCRFGGSVPIDCILETDTSMNKFPLLLFTAVVYKL